MPTQESKKRRDQDKADQNRAIQPGVGPRLEIIKKNGPPGEMGLAFLCSAKYKERVATVRPRDMPSLGVSSLDFPGRFLAAFFLPF